MDIELLTKDIQRPKVKEDEGPLEGELDSLVGGLHPLISQVQVSLFSRFPRLPLVSTCLRARMDGIPQVVWCDRPEGCAEVTRRSWSWPIGEGRPGRDAGQVVICAAIASGGELKGVVKASTEGEEARYGQLAAVRLLGKAVAVLLQSLDGKGPYPAPGISEREMRKALLEAQEREREWVGLEVHDGVAQTLSVALCYLRAARKAQERGEANARTLLTRAESLVHQSILETRAVLKHLVPPRLKSIGLTNALREELRHFQESSGCSVEFHGGGVDLPEEVSLGLYRIATEALNNARRHSGTQRVRLVLEQRDGAVLLEVTDWGRGFDPERVRWGTGLEGMRCRAESLGGCIFLSTAPGKGTTVRVTVPILFPGPGDGKEQG